MHTGQPYYIKGIRYVVEDPVVSQLLCLEDSVNQGLKPGMQFRVESLDNERKRITDMLVDNGFYKFNKDYITYEADTVGGANSIDLTLVLHPYRGRPEQTLCTLGIRCAV